MGASKRTCEAKKTIAQPITQQFLFLGKSILNIPNFEKLCAAIFLVIVLSGCGDDGPRMYDVSGSVNYQGKEVADGSIIFESHDGVGPTAAGSIVDGQYTIQTTSGKKVIRITATKETGRMLIGAMDQKYPEIVDIIPPKHNSGSTLIRTVDPEESLIINFDLD